MQAISQGPQWAAPSIASMQPHGAVLPQAHDTAHDAVLTLELAPPRSPGQLFNLADLPAMRPPLLRKAADPRLKGFQVLGPYLQAIVLRYLSTRELLDMLTPGMQLRVRRHPAMAPLIASIEAYEEIATKTFNASLTLGSAQAGERASHCSFTGGLISLAVGAGFTAAGAVVFASGEADKVTAKAAGGGSLAIGGLILLSLARETFGPCLDCGRALRAERRYDRLFQQREQAADAVHVHLGKVLDDDPEHQEDAALRMFLDGSEA